MGSSFLPFSSLPSRGNESKASSTIISRKELIVLCLVGILSLGAGVAFANATSSSSTNSQRSESALSKSDQPYRLPSISKMVVFLREEARAHQDMQEMMSEYKDSVRNDAHSQKSEVRVNGENVPVPASGNLNKTIETENGRVEIRMESHSNQSNGQNTATSRSRNSTSIDINSRSDTSSQSKVKTKESIRID